LATKKEILITAGPTWVALDQARVISNLATGETGFILAEKFKKQGFKVTLLLGPGSFCAKPAGIRLIRFKYFAELDRELKKLLKSKRFSAIIHAAAVSDYRPRKVIRGKLDSSVKSWKLELVPTQKLINRLGRYSADLFKVGFKFQPQADKNKLLGKGKQLLTSAYLDLVVANSNRDNGYQAFILGPGKKLSGPFTSKSAMAGSLCALVGEEIRKD
jgi:phosphopantothenoylcysteine decarboxylase/phosphopantothenate--cysteine ligase